MLGSPGRWRGLLCRYSSASTGKGRLSRAKHLAPVLRGGSDATSCSLNLFSSAESPVAPYSVPCTR